MTSLMLVGGVGGVGTTTLISSLLPGHTGTTYLDSCELFARQVWREKSATVAQAETRITDQLVGACHRPGARLVVVSWHYACLTPEGYVPRIPLSYWKVLVGTAALDTLTMVKVVAPLETLLERRTKSCRLSSRRHSFALEEEMVQSDFWYQQFANAASRFTEVVEAQVENVGVDCPLAQISRIYEEAYAGATVPCREGSV